MTDMVEYNRSELIKLWANSDEELPFTLFYGGHNNSGVGPHVFSQWYGSLFKDERGIEYNCAEQYMMAEKARLFSDSQAWTKIMAEPQPSQQKKLGRTVKNFNNRIWARYARGIVLKGSWFKFISDPALEGYLLSTEGEILIEASPTDTVWGIGRGIEDKRCYDPVAWNGLNWLGFSIMVARTCIIGKMAPTGECAVIAQEHYGQECKTCQGKVQ